MAFVLRDRVKETTTSIGTGSVTLAGAASGFQSFSVIGNGNTTFYAIVGATEWEVGIGTYSTTGPTLARTTVLESSNAGALVNFSAGTKDVFVTYGAERSVYSSGTGHIGIPDPSTSGNALISDGTSWTSKPTNTVTLTANGSIAAGAPVIQNADGTVSAVTGTLGSAQLGDIVTNGNTANAGAYAAAYDPNLDRIVWATRNSSNQVTLNLSRAVGNGITFEGINLAPIGASAGTPVSIVYNPDVQRFVIFYTNGSGFACARVFTIAGSSVQLLGAEVVFNSVTTWDAKGIYDPVSKKIIVLLGHNTGVNSRARAFVGTMTSTSISFGTAVDAAVAFQGSASDLGITYDTVNSKVVIAYGNVSGVGVMMVGTVSGTSISFGSASSTFGTNSWAYVGRFSLAFDENAGKVVAVYQDGDISDTGYSVVGTVSGTSISIGTPVLISGSATSTLFTSAVYDPTQKKIVACNNIYNNSYCIGTVSGTSISWTAYTTISTNTTTSYVAATYANNNQTPVLFFYSAALSKYTGTVLQPYTVSTTNLTNSNFLGFSTAAYTNGQSAVISISGSVNTNQTGLKSGQTYYVQPDGTLNIYPYWINVYAGRAVSATNLLVKG